MTLPGHRVMGATRDYVVRMPRDTSVVAACHEVRCEAWQFGWETLIDERTPLGAAQAAYIRHQSGRAFTELRSAEPCPGGVTVFRFEPRQRCFAEHRTRPARWLIRNGSLREVPTMADWTGDLGDHMNRLQDQLGKG